MLSPSFSPSLHSGKMPAAQGMYIQYGDNENMKLSEWMIVAGACMAIFSLTIPHLHGLRVWSGIACACTIMFAVIVIGIAAWDGMPALHS